MADPVEMSLRAYARRKGVSAMSVTQAHRAGRLRESVARDDEGRVIGIKDPVLADLEWEKNSDMMKAPAAVREASSARAATAAAIVAKRAEVMGADAPPARADPETLGDYAAEVKLWDARLKELKYREAAGELVEAATVERRLVDVFTACKAAMLAIPSRVKQALPHLTVADVAAVDALVREALEQLADGKAGTT